MDGKVVTASSAATTSFHSFVGKWLWEVHVHVLDGHCLIVHASYNLNCLDAMFALCCTHLGLTDMHGPTRQSESVSAVDEIAVIMRLADLG